MIPSKVETNGKLNKPSPSKSTNRELPPINSRPTPNTSTPLRSPGDLHPSSFTPPLKTNHPSSISPRNRLAVSKLSPSPRLSSPQQIPPRKPSATPSTSHLHPDQPRKPSVAPRAPSPGKIPATPKSSHLTPPERRTSIALKSASPLQAAQPLRSAARKLSTGSKPPSPPKPDWVAPPGKPCSFSPSPTQIPVPVFVCSARRDVSASPGSGLLMGSGTGGLCTPVSASRRRTSGVKSAVKESNPLLCEVGKEDIAEIFGKEDKQEAKGLGLSFNDPVSSALGSGSSVVSLVSSIPVSALITPRARRLGDVFAPTSPSSPGPRIYTPTSTATTPTFTTAFTTIACTAKYDEQPEKNTEKEEPPKRDSLSLISPTSVAPPLKSTFPSSATPKPHFSRLPLLAKHHRYRYLGTQSTLPPSSVSTHPYTGNTHITPSCTMGALTHRLICGHLIITVMPEVCSTNCEQKVDEQEGEMRRGQKDKKGWRGEDDGARERERQGDGWERVWREKIQRKRKEAEEGFVANVRNLDAQWECACCGCEADVGVGKGMAKDKGRRCAAVLGVELGG